MDVEMFFSDLHNLGGPEKWQQSVNEFEQKANFKSVSMQKFKIQRLPQGMSEFVPITFEDQYFSVLNCYVQSVLLDFRFRLVSFKNVQSEISSLIEKGVASKAERLNNAKKISSPRKIAKQNSSMGAKDDQDALMT
mmetsp:Transcript_23201/g.22712  ORF Transcript_23201/g.22712 Transcript_23201/m.22712 type:complete len:136 (-) Transcript_23201:361-768(-)